jgi:eukaryotic-like serine/threonine-protein kinase
LCPNTEKLLPLENRILDGKFRFLRQLGEGGMGAVWQAENILVKKTVAIKLMHVQFSRNEGVLARFRNEATAAGRIGSKHICDILDLGKSELGPYIVMEMLCGSDLADFIQKRGPVDPGTLAMIMRQALVGLQAAHAVGIVHRDLKPENIFLHEPEPGRLVVKLMDFGISKFTEGSEAGKTGLGVLMGTPEYMSPEQTEGAAEVDSRTDIWAMGVIMYWALTGKNPFSGPTLAATLMNVAKGDAPSLATLTPNLPPALIEVVARCLKRDPQQRWQSAQQLHDALAPFENLSGGVFTPMTSGPPKGATMASAHMPAGTPPPGATVAAQASAGIQAPAPGPQGAPTWSNQVSGTPQAAPTIAGPSSWTVNDDYGRPESLSGGGNGMLIGVVVVIVLGLIGGGWALVNGMSKSDDDDEVVAVADDGKAPEEGEGKGDAADGEPAGEDGEKPAEADGGAADDSAADKTDDGAAAGEEDGGAPAEGDDGAAADADDGSEPAGDDGAAADEGGDDAAGDDGGDDGGSKTSGGTTPKPKPKPTKLVLVASTRVANNVTFDQAKRHCANLTDRGSSSWALPAQNQAHLIRGSHAWLSDGRIWDPTRKQAAKVVGARPSRAVCVARVKA